MKSKIHYVTLLAGMLSFFGFSVASAGTEFPANSTGHKAPFKIGISNGYIGNQWRAQFVSDIEKVAKELKAAGDVAEVRVLNSTSGTSGQLNQLNALINSGVDALIIDPDSPEALKPAIQRAIDAGILVVVTDNAVAMNGVLNVVYDQANWSSILTHWLVGQLNGKGNIISIDGLAGASANATRLKARDAILTNFPDIKIVASGIGGFDQAKAREVTASILAVQKDIDGVFTQDAMPEGEIRAFKAAGRTVPPIGGDYTLSFLKSWKADPQLRTIGLTSPTGIGALALRITVELLRGKALDSNKLAANPVDPTMANALVLAVPIVVTRTLDEVKDQPWCKTEGTECISLDDALERLKGAEDSVSLDINYTQQEVIERFLAR